MTTPSLTKTLLTTALLVLAATRPAHAILPSAAPDDPRAYIVGTKAMDEHRWQDAVGAFDQVINAKAKKVDAALYWKAYSLNKLGNGPLALATCFQLRSQFTSSTWNKDCDALSIDVSGPQNFVAPPVPPVPPFPPAVTIFRADRDRDRDHMNIHVRDSGDPNQDIKMLALNSLLNQDPTRAIPLLRGILTGDQPDAVKKHAIFVLAQSKSPEAESILHDAVTGKINPTLQRETIQMMGVFQGKRANETLAEVYRNTTDDQIKRSVISAFFVSGDAPRLVDLARNEKNLELKRQIVAQLALMHDKAATDYMIELLK